MIKREKKIEFAYEKEIEVVDQDGEETSTGVIEFWVEFDAEGEFGPTVSYTEEMDSKKRDKADWTHMPLSFFVEITEFLHKEGHIEKVNWVGGDSKLAKPVVSKKTRSSGGGISVPNISGGFQQPTPQTPQPSQTYQQPQPYAPVHNHPQGFQGYNGPQVIPNQEGGFEVHNSQPPYQHPERYASQQAPPSNPFGNNVAPKPEYGVPSANIMEQQPFQQYQPQYSMQPQQPQQNIQPIQSFSQTGGNNYQPQQQYPQQPQQPQQNSQEGDLTSMLNEEVAETPEFLKGAAKNMMEQRANFLRNQMSGGGGGKRLSAVGTLRETPVLEG